MREVSRGPVPECVSEAVRTTPTLSFDDLKSRCGSEIRSATFKQQKGLCAFCCDALNRDFSGTRIAHVEPQSRSSDGTTDFRNFALSCNSEKQADTSCDAAQGNQSLPLSPFTKNVEREFHYKRSGQMSGLTDSAKETIKILNLDSEDENEGHRLRTARRLAIDNFIEYIVVRGHRFAVRYLTEPNRETFPPFQPALKSVYEGFKSRLKVDP